MTHSFDDDDKEVLKAYCGGVELTDELLERFHASAGEQFMGKECDCPKKAAKTLIAGMRSRLPQVEAEKDMVIKPDVTKPGVTLEMIEAMHETIKGLQARLEATEEANARLKQYAENTHLGLTAFVTVYEMQAIHGAGSHAALPENCLTTVQRTALAGLTEKKEV